MELSQKLRQARLAAGLSQKQLCGDKITRNMLSQIENGSARPSMDTLKYLAQRLGKSISYFLEETAVTSPNQALMEKAREANPSEVLQLLGQYQSPDPVFDRERWLLEAVSCLTLAERALRSGQSIYAKNLLERAAVAGKQTPYYRAELEHKRLLLAAKAGERVSLPDISEELLLRAEQAYREGNFSLSVSLLDCCKLRPSRWHLLKGLVLTQLKDYAAALEALKIAREAFPRQALQSMEVCCRELGDFQGAYECACALREL